MIEEKQATADEASVRVAAVPARALGALVWIGPMLMLLGAAVGSGELLAEPAAGARHGGSLLWAIVLFILTKAFWNEVVGRVSIVTGQNFVEACCGAGPGLAWVPWAWYVVNVLKDFFLRGGIVAIAGLICYDVFGPLPLPSSWSISGGDAATGEQAVDSLQAVVWTFLNYGAIWLLLLLGGYTLAERINTALCLLFTLSLTVCAFLVLPTAVGELGRGLLPTLPTDREGLLMLVSLSGIVMSGSTTVYYSAWAEERGMGLLGFVRRIGRRLTREQFEPQSREELRRMRLWLRINRINVTLTYCLGALVCLSTFVLGVGVLRPAGVRLTGAALAPELSLMMTEVIGPWAKGVFYVGGWAAVVSTAVGILDGGSRMYVQPLRHLAPELYAKVSFGTWQKLLMTLMVAGSWSVYVLYPDALTLVIWMGLIDAPLVGVLILAYAYLGRRYLPQAYRSGVLWTIAMCLTGLLYLGLSACCLF